MRSTFSRYSLLIALATSLVGGACGRAFQSGSNAPPLVTFTNESVDQVTVYAMRPGGDARRIASVMANRTDTLSLPSSITSGGQVTIIAVPMLGSGSASSGPISIGPGDRIAIRLPSSQGILSVLPIPPL